MKVSFELTMPNVGSWNGKWTGEGNKYYIIRTFFKHSDPSNEKIIELLGDNQKRNSWYYNFGDGWGANVIMEIIDSTEAKRREKISSGFSTYEWMIDEILKHGRILTREERIQNRKEATK